jgi:hypothetical protein
MLHKTAFEIVLCDGKDKPDERTDEDDSEHRAK